MQENTLIPLVGTFILGNFLEGVDSVEKVLKYSPLFMYLTYRDVITIFTHIEDDTPYEIDEINGRHYANQALCKTYLTRQVEEGNIEGQYRMNEIVPELINMYFERVDGELKPLPTLLLELEDSISSILMSKTVPVEIYMTSLGLYDAHIECPLLKECQEKLANKITVMRLTHDVKLDNISSVHLISKIDVEYIDTPKYDKPKHTYGSNNRRNKREFY